MYTFLVSSMHATYPASARLLNRSLNYEISFSLLSFFSILTLSAFRKYVLLRHGRLLSWARIPLWSFQPELRRCLYFSVFSPDGSNMCFVMIWPLSQAVTSLVLNKFLGDMHGTCDPRLNGPITPNKATRILLWWKYSN